MKPNFLDSPHTHTRHQRVSSGINEAKSIIDVLKWDLGLALLFLIVGSVIAGIFLWVNL